MEDCKYCKIYKKENFTALENGYIKFIKGETFLCYNLLYTCEICHNKENIRYGATLDECNDTINKLCLTLSERMEKLRKRTEVRLGVNDYVLIMLDGCNFSKYTKNLNKPFDEDFIKDMNETTEYLYKNIPNCRIAYTQSDEISLFLTSKYDADVEDKSAWRGNRMSKLLSLTASMASAKFMELRLKRNIKDDKIAYFDSKVWNVDFDNDVYAWFLYRQNDCIRNSVLQYAQEHMSHNSLMNKKVDEIKELLAKKELDWESLSDRVKCGKLYCKDINNGGWLQNSDLIKDNKELMLKIINNEIDE